MRLPSAKTAFLAAFLVLAGMPYLARAAPLVQRDPAKLQAGIYRVEPDHTQILFSVLHMGFTSFYGFLSQASGTLSLAPADLAQTRLAISVPVASLATTSTKLDGILQGGTWLDGAKFPTMMFSSTEVTRTGPSSADIAGVLTLHGVTRPVTLHARFVGAGPNVLTGTDNIGFQANGVVKRSDFGITALPLIVGDEVQIAIAAAFEK